MKTEKLNPEKTGAKLRLLVILFLSVFSFPGFAGGSQIKSQPAPKTELLVSVSANPTQTISYKRALAFYNYRPTVPVYSGQYQYNQALSLFNILVKTRMAVRARLIFSFGPDLPFFRLKVLSPETDPEPAFLPGKIASSFSGLI